MSSPVYHEFQLSWLEAGPTLTSVSENIQGTFALLPEIGCEVTADSAIALPFLTSFISLLFEIHLSAARNFCTISSTN